MWSPDELAAIAADALRRAETVRRDEQAVYGLDACEELDLHPLLAQGFADAGYGVHREVPYPGDRGRRGPAAEPASPLPALRTRERIDEDTGEVTVEILDDPAAPTIHSADTPPIVLPLPDDLADDDTPGRYDRERRRCDIVLTPMPGQRLIDPVQAARARRTAKAAAENTLFGALADADAAAAEAGATTSLPPEEAFWIEVKAVGQFCYEAGIPGPNRAYASELVRAAVSDLAKLAKDRHIASAALLLVLFTADAATADHDLVAMVHRCLDRGIAASTPVTERFPITDRIGNGLCSVSLIRARAD